MNRPLIGIATIVRKDGKVLMHKRKNISYEGSWAFAGGHLELWETFEECSLRELKEEAGNIKVVNLQYWTTINTMSPDANLHYVVIFMVCDYVSGEPTVMEHDKCECWEWFDWQDLPKPLMQGIQILKSKNLTPFFTNFQRIR